MWWSLIIYRLVGLLGYSCSILFNTFLAVLRSIKVCNPFYRPKIWLLKLSGLLYILLLLGLTAYDLDTVIRNPKFSNFLTLWYFVASVEERSPYPGSTIPWGIFVASGFSNTQSSIVQFTILSVIYILPVAVVVVSMIIQVYMGVRRTQARNDESVVINDWSHVNTTVFLLAAVFLTGNTALSLTSIIMYILRHGVHDDTSYEAVAEVACEVQGVVTTVLPLLNAVLTPIIIVSRNPGLQQDIVKKLKGMCGGGTRQLSDVD